VKRQTAVGKELQRRFYIVGTKYGGVRDQLPSMVAAGVIATGFARRADLRRLLGRERMQIEADLRRRLPHENGVSRNTLARLLCLRPGDLVALKAHSSPRGKRARLVIARYAIVRGRSMPSYRRLPGLGHCIAVEFLPAQAAIELNYGYGQTLHEITDPTRIEDIFGPYAGRRSPARQATLQAGNLADKAVHTSRVFRGARYEMKRVHNEIQNELRRRLVALFGEAAVYQEQDGIDLCVKLPRRFIMIEVKSSLSPVTCIRQALGQMLHYALNLTGQVSRVVFVVVGPRAATANDAAFIDYIRHGTGLNLRYCTAEEFDRSVAAA